MNKSEIKMNPKILFLLLLGGIPLTAGAQDVLSLNIDSCYVMTERNYPLVNQYALIEKSRDYTVSNVSKGYLPQLTLSGQASYQTEVTELPISIPNVNVPTLNKDQYKAYVELNQPITDLFTTRNKVQLAQSRADVERQKIDVELHKLRERVNQLFFGIILIDAQLKQVELLQSDIQSGINRATVAFENGASLKSNIDLLSAELLNAGQRQIELRAMRRGYVEMLSAFIGREITEETVFQKPEIIPTSSTINRPELALFETQKKGFDIQDKLLTNQNLPRVSLFLQGGYGRPSLNFLSNDFSPYAIGGVRLSWNISGLYTHRKQKKNIEINRNSVDVQRDLFLFNTNLTLTQQDSEIAKLRELMASDCEIIELRESVKRSTESQLENGTATANDYIQHVNAEDQARQNLVLHEIQLLMALYNHKTTSGN